MRTDPFGNELLRCMYYKHGAYYYVKGNKWQRIGHTYNAALRWYADEQRGPGAMPDLIRKAYTRYELAVKQGDMSESTLKAYQGVKERLLKAFANLDPEDVTLSHINQYLSHYHGANPNVRNRAIVVLRASFDIGTELGICEYNPALQAKRAKERERKRRLTDAEFKAIRHYAKGQLPLIMDVLYYTAQRVSDVLAIRQSDIENGVIHFTQRKTGTPLDIEIGPELDKAIREARKGPVAGLWLFSGHGKPLPYNTVRSAFKVAVGRSGVAHTTLHDIRAKAITDMSLAGHDAQAIAGHKDPRMTERYVREKVVPVVKSLDSLRR